MATTPDASTSSLTLAAVADADGCRLDQFWSDRLGGQGIARARIQTWIKDGQASVNERVCSRAGRRLAGGDRLELRIPPEQSTLQPEDRELRIIHKDEDVLVLNKPAGLVMHPAPGLSGGTLAHRLVHHFPVLAELSGARPGIVHRLDKGTTGLLVVALNESTRLALAQSFARREVDKVYLALVHGRPRPKGCIDAALGRHPTQKTKMAVLAKGGRPAQSEYTVLWTSPQERFSLVQVRIFSGRTHQVRVHMQHAGHPLLGDQTYCPEHLNSWQRDIPGFRALLNRPMLHAWKLGLDHPRTGTPLRFQLPPPKDMIRVMLIGSRTTQHVGLTGMPGCGKSALLAGLADCGIPVWNADLAIRELYQPGRDGWDLIRRRFGDRFIPDETSPVDKSALMQALRRSPHLRRELEAMIHPLVRHQLECFWNERSRDRVAAAEVPLLLETGWTSGFDVLVGLACDPALRRDWLRSRRGWDENQLADVESWQWPEAKKLRACNIIVDNPGSWDALQARAKKLAAVLQWLRRQKARRTLRHIQDLVNPL